MVRIIKTCKVLNMVAHLQQADNTGPIQKC